MEQLLKAPSQFNFENTLRNEVLKTSFGDKKLQKYAPGTFKKTGTTIIGIMYGNKEGVVLAADTRATGGNIVMDKNCEKIHYISDSIYCCGAGTAADTEATTEMVSSSLNLHSYKTGEPPRVASAMRLMQDHLFRHMGYVSAALILGGYDRTGAHLCSIWPNGSVDSLPYLTMGSGSLAAQSVLETKYKDGLTREEACNLAVMAIEAGITNDLGSGSNVDVCAIDETGAVFYRNVKKTGTESAGNMQIL